MAAEYPLHVVCEWIGNTEMIAAKHYLQVTDADFERRSKIRCSKPEATASAVQSASDSKGRGIDASRYAE